MIYVNYNGILEDEIKCNEYTSDDAKCILGDKNIKIYLFLINNIKNNIEYPNNLDDVEWNFYVKKLIFLKKVVNNANLIKKYKNMLIKNINNYLITLNNFDLTD
tara:strand:+ start:143 stop:454 length:312 start_codon:yes stop_codon:yes gene_type:complete